MGTIGYYLFSFDRRDEPGSDEDNLNWAMARLFGDKRRDLDGCASASQQGSAHLQ